MKKAIIIFVVLLIVSIVSIGCANDATQIDSKKINEPAAQDVAQAGEELFMQGYWLTIPRGYECSSGGYNGWMYEEAYCKPTRSDFDYTIWFDYGFVIFSGAIEDAKLRAVDDYNGQCNDIDTSDWDLETLAFVCFYSTQEGKPGMVLGLVHDSYYLDATIVANDADVDLTEHTDILIDFAKEAVVWQPEGTSPTETG